MRKSYFLSGVIGSYISLIATTVYAITLVPIALRYLPKDEFGLWMVLVQASTYLTLLELGIFPAAARILIDHKDSRLVDGAYGAAILGAAVIFVAQAMLILVLGYWLADFVTHILSVPPHLTQEASTLFKWFVVAAAVGTFSRVWSAVLYANHRMDLVALIQGITPLLGLVIAWWLLSNGGGLAALPWAIVPPVVVSGSLCAIASWRLGLLPKWGSWRLPYPKELTALCKLGLDVFAVNIGQQLLQASQLLIVSRTLGLTAAAVWSVSTKLFSLIYQLIIRVENTAIVSFAEMLVRGEKESLRKRFRQIYQLTAGLAVAGLGGTAALNPSFVAFWASPELAWPPFNGALLACLMAFNLVIHCHTDLIIHSKSIGALRYLVFLEGITFIASALLVTPIWGFTGLLLCALFCALVFRAPYCITRASQLLDLSKQTLVFVWLRPFLVGGFIVGALSLAVFLLTHTISTPLLQFAIVSAALALPLLLVFYFVCLPHDLHPEILQIARRLRSGGRGDGPR